MDFKLNRVYKFNTLAPAVLGGEFSDMKVKGILTSKEAIKYRDIVTLHNSLRNVVSSLPNVDDCSFILFETLNKDMVVFAIEYIDPYSIVETVSTNIRIDIPNSNMDTASMIRAMLNEIGIINFNISTY